MHSWSYPLIAFFFFFLNETKLCQCHSLTEPPAGLQTLCCFLLAAMWRGQCAKRLFNKVLRITCQFWSRAKVSCAAHCHNFAWQIEKKWQARESWPRSMIAQRAAVTTALLRFYVSTINNHESVMVNYLLEFHCPWMWCIHQVCD